MPRKRRFNHASVFRRIGAYIIDSIILVIFFMFAIGGLIFFDFISSELFVDIGGEPGAVFSGVLSASYIGLSLLSSLVVLLYFSILESKIGGGSTLGKNLFNIKVIGNRGEKIGLGPSLLRNILRWLWQIPCLGFIILIIDVLLIADSDQRIGDKIIDTYVVEEIGVLRSGSVYDDFEDHTQFDSSGFDDERSDHEAGDEDKPITESKDCPLCGEDSLVTKSDSGMRCVNCGYET